MFCLQIAMAKFAAWLLPQFQVGKMDKSWMSRDKDVVSEIQLCLGDNTTRVARGTELSVLISDCFLGSLLFGYKILKSVRQVAIYWLLFTKSQMYTINCLKLVMLAD